MKTNRTLLAALFMGVLAGLATQLPAQPTCDTPLPIFVDDFEGYQEGALGPQSNEWTTWSGVEGGAEDGIVSSEIASSGSQSLKIEGQAGGGPQDVLLLLGDRTSSHYRVGFELFIPAGSAAYYNIQHFENPGMEWAFEVYFNTDGSGSLNATASDITTFSFPHDEWINVDHIVNIDDDRAYLYINGQYVYSWPFSAQANSPSGTNQLGAFDFFPTGADNLYFVDNVYYEELPPADMGYYCHTAIPIEEGTHTVPELTCYGGYDYLIHGFSTPRRAESAMWYSYTVTADGVLRVASCDGGADTRVWIFKGDCSNPRLVGMNDDRCELAPMDDEYASYREVPVSQGDNILIAWDDIWDDIGFDFELALDPNPPTPGDFCQSAIEVEPGTHTIEVIDGDGAVSGPNIGPYVSSTTPYAQSEWYVFTPEVNGLMTVTTCGETTEDTRLWVYTGSCGFDDLELLASSDDDCDLQSLVLDLEVVSGNSYFIEWDSEDTDSPGFDWVLEFNPSTHTLDPQLEAALHLFPNPSAGWAVLEWELDGPATFSLELTDLQGRSLHRWETPSASAGLFELDLRGQAPGVYFLRITEGERYAVKRIVLQ